MHYHCAYYSQDSALLWHLVPVTRRLGVLLTVFPTWESLRDYRGSLDGILYGFPDRAT